MSPLNEASIFLLRTLFDMYLSIILLRLLLPMTTISYNNPFVQFVVRATNILIRPARRLLPAYRKFDTASFVMLLVLSCLKIFCIAFFLRPIMPQWDGVLIWACGDIAQLTFTLYFYIVIFSVLSSWLPMAANHPLLEVIRGLAAPLLRPFKRWVPSLGGIDISPIPALLLLQLLTILIANPAMSAGMHMV